MFCLNRHANLASNEWTLKSLNCIYSEVNLAHVSSGFSRIMVKACCNVSRRFKARGRLFCLALGSTGWKKRSNWFSGVVTTIWENWICLWNSWEPPLNFLKLLLSFYFFQLNVVRLWWCNIAFRSVFFHSCWKFSFLLVCVSYFWGIIVYINAKEAHTGQALFSAKHKCSRDSIRWAESKG